MCHIAPCRKVFKECGWCELFFVSSCRHGVNAVFFLLSDSPASEFYVPTFRNTMSEDGTECSEKSAQNSDARESPKRKNTKNAVSAGWGQRLLPTQKHISSTH